MMSGLKVCAHCRRDVKIRISEDIGFRFHWKDNYFMFEVVLLDESYRGWWVLYREVYVVKGWVKF